MSQCVPSWDMDDNPAPARLCSSSSIRLESNSTTTAPHDVPMLDYEVAELTWENGQLGMHAFGPPRIPLKTAGGTLESIVNQATTNTNNNNCLPLPLPLPLVAYSYQKQQQQQHEAEDVVPRMRPNRRSTAAVPMDALVPNSSINNKNNKNNKKCSCCCNMTTATTTTAVGSCSADPRGLARVPSSPAWSSRDQSFSTTGSGLVADSISVPDHSLQREMGDDEEEEDDDDKRKKKKKASGGHGHQEKSSGNSAKRSRAAAIHNQSERKRRDKINQRMKTLQKLVPNSNKTDKASMLDEVIEYLKQLQSQIHMMSRMNIPAAAAAAATPPAMMLPLAMQQQLQMSMMGPMGMGMGLGMGMGMGMDMGRPNNIAAPMLHPAAYMPINTSWSDASTADQRLQNAAPPPVMPDPLSTFLACQSQPMTMEAYSRMAALYQQLQQPSVPNSNKS